jgi:hypothetical protein
MNVGGPNGIWGSTYSPRESEMPIVVKKPGKVKTGRAKGHYYE